MLAKKYLGYVLGGTLAIGLLFLASYVSAAWNNPTATPPDGNTPAPVTVSSIDQVKFGGLSIDRLVVEGQSWFKNSIQITDGTEGLDKVLTSDASGNSRWEDIGNLTGGNPLPDTYTLTEEFVSTRLPGWSCAGGVAQCVTEGKDIVILGCASGYTASVVSCVATGGYIDIGRYLQTGIVSAQNSQSAAYCRNTSTQASNRDHQMIGEFVVQCTKN